MMEQDCRSPLPDGCELLLELSNGGAETYRIDDTISFGGSCIVYLASKLAPTASGGVIRSSIIKEFYPVSPSEIVRESQSLVISDAWAGEFNDRAEKFRNGARICEEAYRLDTNHVMPPPRIQDARANNTFYSVTDPVNGDVLWETDLTRLSLHEIAEIMNSLGNAIGKFHGSGKLYLDLKPQNIFLFRKEIHESRCIGLFDFDTVLHLADLKTGNYQFGSITKGWAPKEQKEWDIYNLGFSTDLFALGAIFFWLLSGRQPKFSGRVGNDLEAIHHGTFDVKANFHLLANADDKLVSAVRAVLDNTLQESRENRWQAIADFQLAVQTILGEAEDNPYLVQNMRDEGAKIRVSIDSVVESTTAIQEKAAALLDKGLASLLEKMTLQEEHRILFDTEYFLGSHVHRANKIKDIHASFTSGIRIVNIYGKPGIGRTHLAKQYVNAYLDQIDHFKIIKIKKSFEDENILTAVVRNLTFDLQTVKMCLDRTREQQFDIKCSVLSAIQGDKLLILSGISDLTTNDLNTLLETNCRFIIISEDKIGSPTIANILADPIPVQLLVELFVHNCPSMSDLSNRSEIEEALGKISFNTLLTTVLAKIAFNYSMPLRELNERLNVLNFNDIDVPAIDKIDRAANLIEMLYELFHFGSLTGQEQKTIYTLSLLPAKNISLKDYTRIAQSNDSRPLRSLNSKGLIEYSPELEILYIQPILAKLVLRTFQADPATIASVMNGIVAFMDYTHCRLFSEVESLLEMGLSFYEKMRNYCDTTPVVLELIQGYQLTGNYKAGESLIDTELGNVSEANKHRLRIQKAQFNFLKFNYALSISEIEQAMLELNRNLTSSADRAGLYNQLGDLAILCNDLNKAKNFFRNSFNDYHAINNLGGELMAVIKLFLINGSQKDITRKLLHHSKLVKDSEPQWYLLAPMAVYGLKFIGIENFNQIRMVGFESFVDILTTNPIRDFILTTRFRFVLNHIPKHAIQGNRLAQIVVSMFNDEELDKVSYTRLMIEFIKELHASLSQSGCNLNSLIKTLYSLADLFSSSQEMIDKPLIYSAILEIYRMSSPDIVLADVSILEMRIIYSRCLAETSGYREAISSLAAYTNEMVRILPVDNRYPLVMLYEMLAGYYFGLKQNKNGELMIKEAIKILSESASNNSVKLADLYYQIGYYRKAVELLESNHCHNCTLCKTYLKLGITACSNGNPKDMTKFYIKMIRVAHKNPICSTSHFSTMLYQAASAVSETKMNCIPLSYYSYTMGNRSKIIPDTAVNNINLMLTCLKDPMFRTIRSHLINQGLKYCQKKPASGKNVLIVSIYLNSVNLMRTLKKDIRALAIETHQQVRDAFLPKSFFQYFSGQESVTLQERITILTRQIDWIAAKYSLDSRHTQIDALIHHIFSEGNLKRLFEQRIPLKSLKAHLTKWVCRQLLTWNTDLGFLAEDNEFSVMLQLVKDLDSHLERKAFCDAEDCLFDCMDSYPNINFINPASYFYKQLSTYSDEDLLNNNYTRAEIDEGLESVKKHYARRSAR